MKNIEFGNMENALEICVLCGKETNVPVNIDISLRRGYIEGAGQLCDNCWENFINPKE